MAGIGSPELIVGKMLTEGQYVPHLSNNCKIVAAKKLNASIKYDSDFQAKLMELEARSVTDLQDDDEVSAVQDAMQSSTSAPNEPITPAAVKEIPVPVVLETQKLLKICAKLQTIAGDLLKALDARLKDNAVPEHILCSAAAFADISWWNEDLLDEDLAGDKILAVINSLNGVSSRYLSFLDNKEQILEGYITFLETASTCQDSVPLSKKYSIFVKATMGRYKVVFDCTLESSESSIFVGKKGYFLVTRIFI